MDKLTPFVTLTGRFFLAFMYVMTGINMFGNYTFFQETMQAAGVPGELLPVNIIILIGGGLAIILGWQTRLTAFILAGWTVVATLLYHSDISQEEHMINAMKNLSIIGGFLLLVRYGGGEYSLDNRKKKE